MRHALLATLAVSVFLASQTPVAGRAASAKRDPKSAAKEDRHLRLTPDQTAQGKGR